MPAAGETAMTTLLAPPPPDEPGDDEAEEEQPKKRSPWTWPLIALIALLVIALVVTLITLFANGGAKPSPTNTPSPTVTSHTPTPTPTPTKTEAPTSATINKADYVGLSFADASAKLKGLGFTKIAQSTGQAATNSSQVGQVYDVNPIGNVSFSTNVTLTVYGAVVNPSAPTDKVTANPTSVAAGGQVQFTWGDGQCPAGQQLTGHQLYINGTGQGPVSGTGNPAPWTAPTSAAGTSVQATYTIFCGQSVESPQSPALAVPVTAAQGGGGNP
jgi:serine/threonine-protein kinase